MKRAVKIDIEVREFVKLYLGIGVAGRGASFRGASSACRAVDMSSRLGMISLEFYTSSQYKHYRIRIMLHINRYQCMTLLQLLSVVIH